MSMFGGGGGADSSVGLLETEVAALENLTDQLFFETHDLRTEYRRRQHLGTIKGKVLHIAGHFLSAFCVYKIFKATVNIAFSRVGQKDPVTRAFEIAAVFFQLDIDVELWSQYLSFALVGVLVITSTRSLLINLTKLFHFFASAGSSHVVVLFMSQVMGMYFVSLVIMMRMNMPEQYRKVTFLRPTFEPSCTCACAVLRLVHHRSKPPHSLLSPHTASARSLQLSHARSLSLCSGTLSSTFSTLRSTESS